METYWTLIEGLQPIDPLAVKRLENLRKNSPNTFNTDFTARGLGDLFCNLFVWSKDRVNFNTAYGSRKYWSGVNVVIKRLQKYNRRQGRLARGAKS